jgi:type IV secretion system protein TrbL
VILGTIPNPVTVVTDALGGAAGWAFDKVAEGIGEWVLSSVSFFVTGAIDFLTNSSRPDVQGAWFAGTGSPYATVRDLAAVLLLAFVFLGLIQGLLAGDGLGMVRRVAGNLPLAVGGMVVMTAIVAKLLELTDAMSGAVLTNSGGQATQFLSGFGASAMQATSGFAAVVLGVVAIVAGLLLWVELLVRGALIYLLVAITPLAFAATMWPAARGALRKVVELLVATILSKLVICIAISVGVAALAGAGTAGAGAGLGDGASASLGTLLIGTAILGLAAFAPFVVLKIMPVAEAALVAHGVSRGPTRAAQTGMSTAYSASMLRRLAGSSAGAAGGGPAGAVAAGAVAVGGAATQRATRSASEMAGGS